MVLMVRGLFVMSMNQWLPEEHHPPISSPVSSHPQIINFYTVIFVVVLMAVSVVAFICCCYYLEWRLRLQASRHAARRRVSGRNVILSSHVEIITRVGDKKIKQETSLSVMMPGDSIPSFLAKAKPYGSLPGAELSDLLNVSEDLKDMSNQTLTG